MLTPEQRAFCRHCIASADNAIPYSEISQMLDDLDAKDKLIAELRAELQSYRRCAAYWWVEYYHATGVAPPTPFSSDKAQDQAVREMVDDKRLIAELSERVKALEAWDEPCASCKGEEGHESGGPQGWIPAPCTCHPARIEAEKREADSQSELLSRKAESPLFDRVVAALREARKIWSEADKRRLEEHGERQAEAEKWKAEGDWYGWNFHQGMAGGMTAASIIFYCVARHLDAVLAEVDAAKGA